MKLLLCPLCQDVQKLNGDCRFCDCGKSWGYYVDEITAVIGGATIPLGFENSSLVQAIRNRPAQGLGSRFDAFVIPLQCPTIEAESEARTLSEPTPATGPAQIERPTEHTSPSEPNVVEVE